MNKATSLTNLVWLSFFIAALVEISLGIQWTLQQKTIGFLLAATLGMNSAHVGLTGVVLSLPEYHQTRSHFLNAFDIKKFTILTLTIGLALGLSLSAAEIILIGEKFIKPAFGLAAYQSLLTFHALMQTKGLCLLLFSDRQLSKKVRWAIGWLFTLLLVINGTFAFFEIYHGNVFPKGLLFAGFFVQLPLLVAICWQGKHFASKKERYAYFLFCGRLVLWPLTLFSFIALIGVLSMHGFEYFITTSKMIGNSNMPMSRKKNTAWAAIFSLGFFCVLALAIPSWTFSIQGGFEFTDTKSLLLRYVLATLIFLTIIHIVVDSFIFRFQDPLLATNIKPLILRQG